MTERAALLTSIAGHIRNFREGEIARPTPEHVDRWVSQFSPDNQLQFLREFNFVIDKSFIEKALVEEFLADLVTNPKLAGADAVAFWKAANVLQIQKDGLSQREMVNLFRKALQDKLGLDLAKCGDAAGDYIYLDDVLFSGNRVASDLEAWIVHSAPAKATVHVMIIALHTSGSYYLRTKRLSKAISNSGKQIVIKYWRLVSIENQVNRSSTSDILWPTAIPEHPLVKQYVDEQKYAIHLREVGGSSQFFATEEGRQVLEYEFLIAGLRIMSKIQDQKANRKPLGFNLFGFGFGSTLVTYRNCPNNCPLALWWGDPEAKSGALQWYPLLPRKGYNSPENVFKDFDELA